jgi:signal peptidase I
MIARASIDWMGRPCAAPSSPSLLLGKRTRARIAVAAWLATTSLLLAGGWWAVAPPQLGGGTSFVIVDGTSMLPRLRGEDLVVLRGSGSYRVGEVVGYRSALLHRVVLHRIVAISHGRYTFKGDNNGFVDPERPTREGLVGRMWLHVPAGGRAVGVLRVPWIVGALAALLVLALGLGAGERAATGADSHS